jgi:hypothetical protein
MQPIDFAVSAVMKIMTFLATGPRDFPTVFIQGISRAYQVRARQTIFYFPAF